MAKAKASKTSKPVSTAEAEHWQRRVGLHAGGAVLFVGICAALIWVGRQYVDREVASSTGPFLIAIKHRPGWMSDLLVRQIADVAQPPVLTTPPDDGKNRHAGLAALIGEIGGGAAAKGYSAFDRNLLVQVRRRLAADPWVADVRQVRRAYTDQPGDTIEIDCDYHEPAALVKWGDGFWLVATDGCKLPERYDAKLVPTVMGKSDGLPSLRIIDGVRQPPPEAGQQWPGEDLTAGLKLAAFLASEPAADAVLKIDVGNFSGRVDPREAHLVLETKYNTEIRWGRPIDDDQSFEISPARKLDCLRRIMAQYGRLDANQPWIDVRFDTVRVPGAKPGPGGAVESTVSPSDTQATVQP